MSIYVMTRVRRGLCLCLICALSAVSGCGGKEPKASSTQPVAKAPSQAAQARPAVPAQQTQSPAAPTVETDISHAPAATPQQSATSAAASPAKPNAAARVRSSLQGGYTPVSGDIPACWQPLVTRLQNDPQATKEMVQYFCSLPEYSAAPMGAKVKELFTNAFMRKPRTGTPSGPPSRIYRNMVTAATMQRCKDFLAANKDVFDRMEKKYPVPRETVAALLFVETRHGTYLGKENAFWSLACMAAADSPEMVKTGISDLPITDKHSTWLQNKLTDKSDWAYKEMRALLSFCTVQNLDPHNMPGSVYGAIGICQFMPSNLVAYGDDGDNDGVINLFSEADAIFSAAKYLTKHGWQKGGAVDKQRAVLKRYNNSTIYANTILALAESARTGVVQTGPPDAVKVASAKSGKSAKKSAGKSKKKK